MRLALLLGSCLAAALATIAQAAPAGDAVAMATTPAVDRIARACGEDPACRSRADNRNYYDLTKVKQQVTAGDCDRAAFVKRYGHEPCPTDMAWVCSPKWQVNICMDRDLRKEAGGRYMGNVGRLECKAWCEARGRRLPTNNEWLVACEGTKPSQCLRAPVAHPIVQRLRTAASWTYNDVNCKAGDNAWRSCMADLRLNDRVRNPRTGATVGLPTAAETQRCVSDHGVRNMVGVLGQWVVETYPGAGGGARGQFNGGLYPQPASSCNYTTVAHPVDYSDYSIGCRCGSAIDTSVRATKPPVKRKPVPAPRGARTAATR